ncbi:MAG: dihydroorotate dehydrogenase electron transfer subunit [Bacteroidales bacterium]|nr:dihydroorotate dehydrogenase electron transfer subunit [Bacteroidales bacterium]
MAKRIDDFKIVDNKRLTEDLFILELEGNDSISEFKPGQFVQVRVDESPGTFLRRPISIHDVDYKRNTFKLLIQTAGQGTIKLSELSAGDSLNLIYPLGNSFSDPGQGERILLVGGGVGIAPLLFMGKHLLSIGYRPDWLLGFRSRERTIDLEDYRQIGNVFLTTEDGSAGEKGYVTNHSVLEEKRYDRVYCCGPDPMMKAVASYCSRKGINCEVSLENLMACGIGICLCCIVTTVKGNICTCTDGPVFNITELKW